MTVSVDRASKALTTTCSAATRMSNSGVPTAAGASTDLSGDLMTSSTLPCFFAAAFAALACCHLEKSSVRRKSAGTRSSRLVTIAKITTSSVSIAIRPRKASQKAPSFRSGMNATTRIAASATER